MIEWKSLKLDRLRFTVAQVAGPIDRAIDFGLLQAGMRNDHDPSQRWQAFGQTLGFLAQRKLLAAVRVAIADKKDLGINLPNPIQERLRARIDGARRPDRTKPCRREHGDNGFGNVRHAGGDAISWPYA